MTFQGNNSFTRRLNERRAAAAVQQQVTTPAQVTASPRATRMAGAVSIAGAPKVDAWILSEGIDNGPKAGEGRTNAKGYGQDKTIWANVEGRKEPILRVPYVAEKYQDQQRNMRFEKTRNPTRQDVDILAQSFLQDAKDAGINAAQIVLVPGRKEGSAGSEPMQAVAQRMRELSGGAFTPSQSLFRKKEAPSRNSIYDSGPSEDLSVVYSGHAPFVDTSGINKNLALFAGDSDLLTHLTNHGIGRNRDFSEDYLTLISKPQLLGRQVLLLDDSVNQASSQLASALALHAANPGIRITPMTYWGFAGAPVRPEIKLSRGMSADQIVNLSQASMDRAIHDHRLQAEAYIDRANRYVNAAVQQMRADPVGNFLGGLFTGSSDYDQQKARAYLSRQVEDPRLLELAVSLAAKRVDYNSRSYHDRKYNSRIGALAQYPVGVPVF